MKEEKYFDDIIDVDENTAKDFEFLINAPVSEDDHFVFKSERDWTVDVSKYTEFFTLDLKALSAAIESIPFNENIDIDKKYFTVSTTYDSVIGVTSVEHRLNISGRPADKYL